MVPVGEAWSGVFSGYMDVQRGTLVLWRIGVDARRMGWKYGPAVIYDVWNKPSSIEEGKPEMASMA
jgi:hypothetical protein